MKQQRVMSVTLISEGSGAISAGAILFGSCEL